MQTIPGIDPTVQAEFNTAYWAFQPLPVQKLQQMDLGPARTALCIQLSAQFFIDNPVMNWGWDAYGTMLLRSESGYATYPDATGTRTRPVDLNPADYPAVPIPVPVSGALVGPAYSPGSIYFFLTPLAVKENLPVGFETSADGTNNGNIYVLQYVTQQSLSGQSQQIGRWLQVYVAPPTTAVSVPKPAPVQSGQSQEQTQPPHPPTTIAQGFPGKAPAQ